LLDSEDYTIHFQVLFVTQIAQYATAVAAAYLRVEQRSFTLLLMSLAQMVMAIGLNICFIVYLQWGRLGMLTATLITHGVIGAVAIYLILRRTGVRFGRTLYRDMVKFGLPLIPSSLGSYVAIASDRYFVKEYVSLSETGLYSLGYKVGSMIHSFLTAPFIQIWFPRRYEYFGQENAEQVFARIFSYFMAALVFAALGVSLLSRDILKVMTTEAFWPAYRIVPVIALAHVIHAFYYHFTIAITYKKQTKYYAYLNVMVGILNLLLNFLLIKAYSVWGAAFATLISYLFRSGMVYYYADRLEPIVFEVGRAVKILLCAMAVYAVGFVVASDSLFVDIGIQLLVLMLYPILLFATGFITRQEIATARQYIGQFRRKLTRSRNNDGMDESDQLEQQKDKR
jgi:O-antigen/teichoic acid export membrane protein